MNRQQRRHAHEGTRKRAILPAAPAPAAGPPPRTCLIRDVEEGDGIVERTHSQLSAAAHALLREVQAPGEAELVRRLVGSGYFLRLFVALEDAGVDADDYLERTHAVRFPGETTFVPVVWE